MSKSEQAAPVLDYSVSPLLQLHPPPPLLLTTEHKESALLFLLSLLQEAFVHVLNCCFPPLSLARQRRAHLPFKMAQIPLNCTICPKKPKFSDISHLLTHIGSKGHLAHYHKLQVKSHQEPQARYDLAAYDHWYAFYGLPQLLSERMLSKESKKASGQTRARKSVTTTKSERTASGDPTQPANALNLASTQPSGRGYTNANPHPNAGGFGSHLSALWQPGPAPTFDADETFTLDDDSDIPSSPILRKTRCVSRA